MYCKKCGKDYPKEKKVCKDCRIALTHGTCPNSAKKGMKIAVIAVIAVMMAVIALFLIIGLSGMLPQDLKGIWYETSGFGGIIEFKPNGELEFNGFGEEKTGTYKYNSSSGVGEISLAFEYIGISEFTCDGTTIDIGGAKYTRQEVEQLNYDQTVEEFLNN